MMLATRKMERCFTFVLVFQVFGVSYLVVWIVHNMDPYTVPPSSFEPTEPLDDVDNVPFNNSYFPTLNITSAPWKSAPVLPRAITRFEYDAYIRLLEKLTSMFYQNNITFSMCDGTLLGSYISHDMLPWDDDIDIMVRYQDLPKVKRLFQNPDLWNTYEITSYQDKGNEHEYSLLKSLARTTDETVYYNYESKFPKTNQSVRFHKFKFFYKDSPKFANYSWSWPYIDVKYYKENETHVWNLDVPKRTRYTERASFYPLHLRPFSWLWLPAPSDTREFLINKYKRFWCRNSIWNHREEKKQRSSKVRCWRLSRYYPFVWRDRLEGGTLETLRMEGQVIQMVGVAETYSVFTRPFNL